MSFFEKIAQDSYDETQAGLVQSVAEQLAIVFSNRHDKYWAYDFKKQKPVGLHEIFKLDYFSPDFAKRLAYAIMVFDTRIVNAEISVAKVFCGVQIFVECSARYYDEVIKIPMMTFDL